MTDFIVSWPADRLLSTQTNKSLKSALEILIAPIFMLIASLSVLAILSYAFWIFANNLPPEAMSPSFWVNSIRFSLFIGALLLASIGLILFTILFTYKMIKFAIRQWGEQRAPTAKDYGIMEGLHYGDGRSVLIRPGLVFDGP